MTTQGRLAIGWTACHALPLKEHDLVPCTYLCQLALASAQLLQTFHELHAQACHLFQRVLMHIPAYHHEWHDVSN